MTEHNLPSTVRPISRQALSLEDRVYELERRLPKSNMDVWYIVTSYATFATSGSSTSTPVSFTPVKFYSEPLFRVWGVGASGTGYVLSWVKAGNFYVGANLILGGVFGARTYWSVEQFGQA